MIDKYWNVPLQKGKFIEIIFRTTLTRIHNKQYMERTMGSHSQMRSALTQHFGNVSEYTAFPPNPL